MQKFIKKLLDLDQRQILSVYVRTDDKMLVGESTEQVAIHITGTNTSEYVASESSEEAGNMALHIKNISEYVAIESSEEAGNMALHGKSFRLKHTSANVK
jgi:hypothetical protein